MGLNSYIEFTAFGVYCGEFIDVLVSSNYYVFDISSGNDIFTVKTSPGNYPAIARLARQFRVKTRVVKRSGVYFSVRRYRERIGIPLGMLAFFGVIVIMSNFVWSIKIIGNEQISRYWLLEQLDKSGIRPGVHINSYDANKAELEMTLSIEGLAWVSIERSGSRINVKVSESVDSFDKPITDFPQIPMNTPCNVIAGLSGQLVKAEVYRGELLYEIGSGVNAGDVIVSGIVSSGLSANNDATIPATYVHADAKLFVEVIEVVDFHQPYLTLHKAKNGYSMSNRSVVFLGKRIGREKKIDKYADHVEYNESMTVPRILGFPLPIRVLRQNYVFYDRVEVTDSPADAREKLERQIELYEANFLKDAEIIEKQTEYYPDDEGISGLVRYVFQVDVAVKSEITAETMITFDEILLDN